ncbi:hypothetical protein J7J83_03125 [bacterium]|nr:hypothetical protein [bacterium]
MKKTIIFLLVVIFFSAIGIGIYFYINNQQNEDAKEEQTTQIEDNSKSDLEEEKKEESLPPIVSDDEYAKELMLAVEDYADAMYLLSAIVNIDTTTIEPETWKNMIDNNYDQWKSVNTRSKRIYKYLDGNEVRIFKTAYAQENEVNLQTENPLTSETMKIVNETSKDPILKRIMKKWDLQDSRSAMDMLEYARKDYQENLNADLNLTATRAYLLKKVRDVSFTTVAGLGIVASGGTLAAAGSSSAWGIAEYTAAANLTFGGADMIFSAGEKGYIIDNRFGKAFFKEARKINAIPNSILAFTSLKNLKKKVDLASNMITLYGYKEGIEKLITDQKNIGEEQLYNLAIDPNKDYVGINRDPNSLKDYKNPDKVLETLIQLVPPGTYIVDGKPVVVPGLNPKNTVDESEMMSQVPEVNDEDLPVGPTKESLRIGDYSTKTTIIDKQTGIPSEGLMEFHLSEDKDPYGTITYTTDGSAKIQMGGGPAVQTIVKGTMTCDLTGSFDPLTQILSLSCPYTANNTSTTNGQTVPTTDTGTITVKGAWTNNTFSGTISVNSNMGFDRTVEWTATKL